MDDWNRILRELSTLSNNHSIEYFYPNIDHIKSFSPNKYFILGEKGSGKSELFRFIFKENYYKAFCEYLNIPSKNIHWVPFSNETITDKDFIHIESVYERLHDFWYVQFLLAITKSEFATFQIDQLFREANTLEERYKILKENKKNIYKSLKELDDELKKEDKYIVIGFDNLKSIFSENQEQFIDFLHGLFVFWSTHSERYNRISIIIFIQPHIFENIISQLESQYRRIASNRIELKWTEDSLYSMFYKKILNHSALKQYLKEKEIETEEIKYLGVFAKTPIGKINDLLFHNSSEKCFHKGKISDWILTQSKVGKSFSVSLFIKIFEQAAKYELEHTPSEKNNLIEQESFYEAIQDVSKDYINVLTEDEFPWLAGLKKRLIENEITTTPIPKNKFLNILQDSWNQSWNDNNSDSRIQHPASNFTEFYNLLKEFGITEEHSKMVDFPDIYCYGLGLKRDGGVNLEERVEGKYYVYVTKDCEDEAKRHGIEKNIESLKEKIYTNQSLIRFKVNLARPFKEKNLTKSKFLLCYELSHENKYIVIFLKILGYSDNEYDNFYSTFKSDLSQMTKRYLPEKVIEEAQKSFEKNFNNQKLPTKIIKQPSSSEEQWLSTYINPYEEKKDRFIYERVQWIEEIKNKEMESLIGRIHGDLKYLLNDKNNLIQEEPSYTNTEYNYVVKYFYFEKIDKVVLSNVLQTNQSYDKKKFQQVEEKFKSFKELPTEEVEIEIKQECAKSYPDYILADYRTWEDIEKNDEANLALSPEEVEILQNIQSSDSNELRFPLFVNGRAGSGKTTVIQHLLKPYIELALNDGDLYPIYFTYNKYLLSKAKDTMKILVTKNYDTLSHEGFSEEKTKELDKLLEISFNIFGDFVYSLLSEKSKKENYLYSKKIDYKLFKELYSKKYVRIKNNISSDLAWHTIRTFIKGMLDIDNDIELDYENYLNLSIPQKTVESEVYKKIYETIYLNWYKKELCEKGGYWDEQDIVAEVLKKDYYNKIQSPCIVCDESQDFTRIELELILHLNLFFHRKLIPYQLKNLPLIFAGDPFQTINPSGFRWESIKDLLYEGIIQNIESSQNSKLNFNYKELLFNYRSQGVIVKFLNVIQLLRGTLFDIKDIKPQESWRSDENTVVPTYYDINDSFIIDELKKEKKNLIIIIDCDSSEVDDYIENDNFLKTIDKEVIYSPMEAKGLEWQSVILYKFGETAPGELKQMIQSSKIEDYSPDKHLKLLYFFNRLYVAASRPRKKLVIIDTKDALETFWLFARQDTSEKHLNELTKTFQEKTKIDWSNDKLCFMIAGGKEGLKGEGESPLEIGKRLLEAGKEQEDAKLLIKASFNFNNGDDINKAKEAEAYSLYFEKKYKQSAIRFIEIKEYRKAVESYFYNNDYSSIKNLSEKDVQVTSMLEYRLASLIIDKQTVENTFTKIINELIKGSYIYKLEWLRVFKDIIQKVISKNISKENLLHSTTKFIGYCTEHENKFGKNEFKIFGKFYFYKSDYIQAYRYLEMSGDTNSSEFKVSKAKALNFPENLIPLYEINDYKEILNLYYKHRSTSFTIEQLKAIIEVLKKNLPNNIYEIIQILKKYDRFSSKDIESILIDYSKVTNYKKRNYIKLLQLYIEKLIESENYYKIDDLLNLEKNEKLKSLLNISSNNQKHIKLFYHIIIKEISKIQYFNPEIEIKRRLSDSIWRNLNKEGRERWDNALKYANPKVFGEVLEKLNKKIDTLSFYKYYYNFLKIQKQINKPKIFKFGKKYLESNKERRELLNHEKDYSERIKLEKEYDLITEEVDQYETDISMETPVKSFISPTIKEDEKLFTMFFPYQGKELRLKVFKVKGLIRIEYYTDEWEINLENNEVDGDGIIKDTIDNNIYGYKINMINLEIQYQIDTKKIIILNERLAEKVEVKL